MRLVVTGANGFVGKVVCAEAGQAGHEVVRVVRRAGVEPAGVVAMGEIDGNTDWGTTLQGADVVLHLAARVHVLRESAEDPLAAFRAVNVAGTRRLAEAAAEAGVPRMVLVSSIKAAGAGDPYGRSKLEAEQALREVGERRGLEWVVVRPPLVHGPGVDGNLRRLMGLIGRGVPLPFGGVQNRRSLVGVENLAGLLLLCGTAPQASGQTLLVADQPAVSTPELIRMIATCMGRPARLWSVPTGALRSLGRLMARTEEVERLVGSLEVDDAGTRALLGWAPRWTLEAGLEAMVRAFDRERQG